VKVIHVDHRRGIHNPRNGASRLQTLAGGTGHSDFLLGHSDKDHSFGLGKAAQALFHHVVLALALLKTHQLQALALDKSLDGFDNVREADITNEAHPTPTARSNQSFQKISKRRRSEAAPR